MGEVLYCGDAVLAGADLEPLEKAAVLVEEGKIRAVGRQADFEGFRGKRIGRRVVMPGLVDCHNHMALDADLHNWPSLVPGPEAEHALRAVNAMRRDLRSGVTTARYMGDKYWLDVVLRKAQREGRVEGPRAVIATRGLNTSHSGGIIGSPVDGVEERRRFVRENIAAGADFLKMYVTATVERKRLVCFPTVAEMAVVVDEAHNAGKPVAAHVCGGVGFDRCLELGVDTLEHGYFITPAQVDKLVKADRWLDLTVTPILSDYYLERMPAGSAASFVEAREPLIESMRLAVTSGAKYAVGSDGLHGRLWGDVAYLVDFGASPAQALRAATIQGARMIGLDGEVGSLEPGKCADLIGLDADPLENVNNLAAVSLVVQGGEIRVDGR